MIRLKVFFPVLLLVGLVGFILVWRLDVWVKSGLESAISAVTGTKTEISSLSISLKNSSLKIGRLRIASPHQEFKNLIELAEIVVDFQTLPILEKRVVIDEFSMKGIDWQTPRATSGFLPPAPQSSEPSIFSSLVDESFRKIKDEFAAMPVTQLVDFQVPDSPKEIM
jgi:uncharacterized protein (TIGR03545 family)